MIGVDIGGTNLLIGRVEQGKITQRLHQPIVARGDFPAVVTQTCSLIRELAGNDLTAVGISVAGSVDVANGVVLRAQNLDWDQAPLTNAISSELGCKVVIENDVTSAAWGEFTYGAGRGSDSMLAVWIGTGIGGGLILDGKIWRGALGTGGEFGMGISEHNPAQTHRVLEAFASRSGIQRLTSNKSLTTAMIKDGYLQDEVLTDILNEGARRIGTAIANAITLLSLNTVILGGGLVEALGTPYIEYIRTQFEHDVFPHHCRECAFYMTELGPDAGLLGVADIASQ